MKQSGPTQVRFYDHDMERALLGAVIVDPSLMKQLTDLSPRDFHEERNRWVCRAMLDLDAEGQAIDIVLLRSHLQAAGRLEDLDQGAYLTELFDMYPVITNVPEYVRQLKEYAAKRALYTTMTAFGRDLIGDKYEGTSAATIRDQLIERLQSTVPTSLESQAQQIRWTAAELLAAKFPEPRWAIPGILPVGLAFLAGRPKRGKSYLALQIAIAVGLGGKVLDQDVPRGKVLYLALEDTARRLQERSRRLGMLQDTDVTFYTEWPHLAHEGGIVRLQQEIAAQGYSLAIIDTISSAVGKADQLDQVEMNALLKPMLDITHTADMTIAGIDHHRKPSGFSPNPVDDILGSTAKGAVPDVLLGLYREQGKSGAILSIAGRDIDDKELALQWDGLTRCWQLQGEVGKTMKGSVEAEIVDAIRELVREDRVPSTKNIAAHVHRNKSNVSHKLADLVSRGLLVRGDKIGSQKPYYTPDTLPKKLL